MIGASRNPHMLVLETRPLRKIPLERTSTVLSCGNRGPSMEGVGSGLCGQKYENTNSA